jgi:hypothetical protein|tara:strand:+ start:128 stop:847 length:720 start_codon:yes stop_codon:yes gene_type:complete
MKKLLLLLMLSSPIYGADNEIYIDQSSGSSNTNIDLEQLGSGNIIGGADATAGASNMTPLDLDGTAMTLDINQIGDSNKFLGDIWADSYTGFFEFDGNSNTFNMNTDKTNTFGADSSNVNVDVTGNSNTFTLNHATVAQATTLDLDWIINGSSNSITAAIDIDAATNYMDIDGSDNTVTYDGDGYAGGYFWLDHTGSNRTFNIQQQSTQDNDWLKIISVGSTSSSVCVIQNDQGTSTGC